MVISRRHVLEALANLFRSAPLAATAESMAARAAMRPRSAAHRPSITLFARSALCDEGVFYLPAIERAGLYVTDVEVLRLHYAETLKAWRKRLNQSRSQIAALYDERFCRVWEFYLGGCEAFFRHAGLVNFQIQLAKCIDVVPLTWDYVHE